MAKKENLKEDHQDNISIIRNVETISESKKGIERSYHIENIKGTEAYYSNRYGWSLRKPLD
tara:strand:+ start:188 stop:370 length:183 start_codon:yes stop_codon:yes gene_type:complete